MITMIQFGYPVMFGIAAAELLTWHVNCLSGVSEILKLLQQQRWFETFSIVGSKISVLCQYQRRVQSPMQRMNACSQDVHV